MLHVVVRSEGQEYAVEHPAGPLEIGRGPQRLSPRCLVTDPFVSRDQLALVELPDGRIEVENLSHTVDARTSGGVLIAQGARAVLLVPVRIAVGNSEIEVQRGVASFPAPAPAPSPSVTAAPPPVPPEPAADVHATITLGGGPPAGPRMETIIEPAAISARPLALRELGEAPNPETLAHWFETLVLVQQAAATSAQFLDATAGAVVDLVGLDRGMVLLREGDAWRVGASAPGPPPPGRPPFSSTIVNEVVRQRRTVVRNLGEESMSLSLVGIDTVVAAPVFDDGQQIIGVVYGARGLRADGPLPRISSLEALVIQVLAAAVGAGLEREEQRERALRLQVQFEQFFTPRLAEELAADPSLLQGREREVTVLFSDVRNFSRIAERIGPQRTFAMMQEVMDLQSLHIRATDGVVVDYVGDGLLAMWNAPTDQSDHPTRACRTALGFLADLPALSERWQAEAGEPIRLGVGIHTGPALVGNTGSTVKFKYGPMGPAVNLASRVENSTKALGVSPLVTRATRDRLGPEFQTRRLGGLRVQGFGEPIDVFELRPGASSPEWCQRRDVFERALAHFEQREWSEACQLLAGLLTSTTDYDMPSLQLLSRSVECLRSRPEPFDPALIIQKQA